MPDPSGTLTDGSIVFGAQIATIDTVQFIVEDGRVSRGSSKLETTNEFGIPNKKVHKRTTATGSLTLQLPSSATLSPALFAIVALVPFGGGAALNYIITEVGDQFSAEGVSKVTCSIEQKLN